MSTNDSCFFLSFFYGLFESSMMRYSNFSRLRSFITNKKSIIICIFINRSAMEKHVENVQFKILLLLLLLLFIFLQWPLDSVFMPVHFRTGDHDRTIPLFTHLHRSFTCEGVFICSEAGPSELLIFRGRMDYTNINSSRHNGSSCCVISLTVLPLLH